MSGMCGINTKSHDGRPAMLNAVGAGGMRRLQTDPFYTDYDPPQIRGPSVDRLSDGR